MTNRAGEDGTVATGVVRTVAAEAGCDEVLPRSAFAVRLAEILQRGDPAIGELPAHGPLGGNTVTWSRMWP